MDDTKTLRWPGIPADGRYGRTTLYPNGSAAKPDRCLAEVSEPPHYIHRHQCSRKPIDGGLCRQHATRRDNWLAIRQGWKG